MLPAMPSDAKLTGALLWMVIAAALLAAVGLLGLAFAADRLSDLGSRYTVAVLFITAWSALFVVLTLMRVRATPWVVSGGFLLWIGYRLAFAALTAGWPLVVDLLGEAVLAAGFCGYMASGAIPAAYYRHRLPAP